MEKTDERRRRFDFLAVPVVFVIALLSAIGLNSFRPDLFKFSNSFPAALTYFGLFALLLSCGRARLRSAKTGASEPLPTVESTRFSWIEGIVGEIGLFLILTLLSAVVGAVSGAVWWSAGGYQVRSVFDALLIGAIVGAMMVVFLFTGG